MTRVRDAQDARVARVFRMGWEDANNGLTLDTPSKVHDAYADFTSSDVSVYLNGREDGVRGDTFRLDYNTQRDLLRDVEGESNG